MRPQSCDRAHTTIVSRRVHHQDRSIAAIWWGASSSQHTSSAGRFSFCTPQNTASNLTTTPTTSCSNTYTQPTAHKYICICVFRPNKLFSLEIMADIAVWKRRLRRVLMLGFCFLRVRTAGLSRIENQTNERLFAALTFRAHSSAPLT